MRIIPSTRVLGGGALGLACFLGLALLLMGDTRDGDRSLEGGNKTADEIELEEIDLEIEEAIRSLRARASTPRVLRDEREAFFRLNLEVFARRDELAREVAAAAPSTTPILRGALPPRVPAGESADQDAIREFEDVFMASVEAIRASDLDPAARQEQLLRLLETNAEALAARDALRATIVLPPARATLPSFVPREPVPGETADEAELRQIDDALAAGIHAIRREETGGASQRDQLEAFLSAQRPLLERQRLLQAQATRAGLDAPLPRLPAQDSPSGE